MNERREPGGATLSQPVIREVVNEFYGRIRQDPELGPIFQQRLEGRWPEHLDKMCEFWSTVLLGTRSYRGDPMGAHVRIPGLEPAHFSRWMELFTEVAEDLLTQSDAANIVGRAGRMRFALEQAVAQSGHTRLAHPWERGPQRYRPVHHEQDEGDPEAEVAEGGHEKE